MCEGATNQTCDGVIIFFEVPTLTSCGDIFSVHLRFDALAPGNLCNVVVGRFENLS
jgi:hypothetical protein